MGSVNNVPSAIIRIGFIFSLQEEFELFCHHFSCGACDWHDWKSKLEQFGAKLGVGEFIYINHLETQQLFKFPCLINFIDDLLSELWHKQIPS